MFEQLAMLTLLMALYSLVTLLVAGSFYIGVDWVKTKNPFVFPLAPMLFIAGLFVLAFTFMLTNDYVNWYVVVPDR